MAKKLGVLIVHGMGEQAPDYAQPLIRELHERMEKLGADPIQIAWESAYLADILGPRQANLWTSLSTGHDLGNALNRRLRKFIINAFGDALAYQRIQQKEKGRKDVHVEVHKKIFLHLSALRARLREGLEEKDTERPLVIMAHSLGCFMMSNYIWDRQHGLDQKKFGGNDFLRMKTLAGFITFGSNIPLFSLAYDRYEAIEFPPRGLERYFSPGTTAKAAQSVAKWVNFYDPDDVLGYPLRPLSQSYEKTVSADLPINVGGLLTFWNPASHAAYWTDDDFTKPVASQLAGILKLL